MFHVSLVIFVLVNDAASEKEGDENIKEQFYLFVLRKIIKYTHFRSK